MEHSGRPCYISNVNDGIHEKQNHCNRKLSHTEYTFINTYRSGMARVISSKLNCVPRFQQYFIHICVGRKFMLLVLSKNNVYYVLAINCIQFKYIIRN